MQRIQLSLAVLILALSAACGQSINTAAKTDIDRRVAALSPSARQVEAPTAAEPMALAPGQWLTVKSIDDEKRPSFVTYKVVGEEAGAYWIEVASETYYGKSAVRMQVAFGDRKDPKTFDIRYIASKDADGRVNVVPEPLIGLMKKNYNAILDTFSVQWTELPREDAAVIGGTFAGCFKGRSTVSFAGMSATSDVWWHSAVPINGLVKSVGVDKPMTTELVDFGLEGARSDF